MSTCNFHAVERVADVRPDFALPLGRCDHIYPERVQHVFNPDEAVYIVARSATSGTRTSGVSRGLSLCCRRRWPSACANVNGTRRIEPDPAM